MEATHSENENTGKAETLTRPNRFNVLAETSFKSPIMMQMT